MNAMQENKKEETTKNDLYQKFSEKLKDKKSSMLQTKLYKFIYVLFMLNNFSFIEKILRNLILIQLINLKKFRIISMNLKWNLKKSGMKKMRKL